MMEECDRYTSFLQHIPKIFNFFFFLALDFVLSEALFHNVSLMNHGTVILQCDK